MPELQKAASLSGAASGIGEKTRDPSLFQPSASEVNLYQLHVEDLLSLNPHAEEDPPVTDLDNKLLLWDLLDISPVLTEAASAIIDDSFTRCFKSNTPEPWNWNLYLAPLWCLGVIVRYGILFPIRSLFFLFGFFSFQVCVLCSLSFVPLASVGAVLWNLLKFSIVFIQNQCHNVYICQSVLCGFITFLRNFF
jgi:hypothetical protein